MTFRSPRPAIRIDSAGRTYFPARWSRTAPGARPTCCFHWGLNVVSQFETNGRLPAARRETTQVEGPRGVNTASGIHMETTSWGVSNRGESGILWFHLVACTGCTAVYNQNPT